MEITIILAGLNFILGSLSVWFGNTVKAKLFGLPSLFLAVILMIIGCTGIIIERI